MPRKKTSQTAPLEEKERIQAQTVAINEALTISALRQHELTEEAQKLNHQLQQEIAERKRAEAAKYLLASIVEGSEDSIISIDFDQKITSWNKGAERLYGYSASEAIGRSIIMLALPEDLKEALVRIDRIKDGKTVETFELERVQKDGGHLNVSVTLSAVRDDSGRPIGISTISRDITEQKRLEKELRKAKSAIEDRAHLLETLVDERTDELRQSVKSLQDLNYTMAHDLRAPIRAMKSFSIALLEDVPLNETGKNYAERINAAADRMDQLVNDLLEYAQLTHLDFPMHAVDLKVELDAVILELAKEIEVAHAEVRVRGEIPVISGNETLVKQILSNLISNALKFVEPGATPKVIICTDTGDLVVRLWVEDEGIGVAPHYQEQIFGVFQRLHTPEEFPGTGVGLAIIKRAVERMGGRVGVESGPGKGSRFWVEFVKA